MKFILNSNFTQGANPVVNISFIMSSQFNHKFTVTNFYLRKLFLLKFCQCLKINRCQFIFFFQIPICSKFISFSSHTIINNSSFPEHFKIFSQFFLNCMKKSHFRKSTLIIPIMGEMKLIQKYFNPCRKVVG